MPPWRQSTIALLLKCPRAFELKYLRKAAPDHGPTGYAAPRGTAAHAVAENILRLSNEGRTMSSEDIKERQLIAFASALDGIVAEGGELDADGIERADALLANDRKRLERLAGDPRIRAVYWTDIEMRFEWKQGGRTFGGTLDAAGTALRDFPAWGVDGRDVVDLRRGDRVLVDWKNGEVLQLSRAARRVNLQLAFYALALQKRYGTTLPWPRCFVGALRDLDTTTRPKDAAGEGIPKTLRVLNPAFVAALGVSEEEADASRKGPKDAAGKRIPKRLEGPNPAWLAACDKPRGKLLRMCAVDHTVARASIAAAIKGAEAGLYPATGGLTGACDWCAYKGACEVSA